MSKHTLGDGPIQPEYQAKMKAVAQAVGEFFGPDTGFILMVFPVDDHGGRCNYMSNARREDVVTLLKEQLARFEGQPGGKGKA